MVFKSSFLAPSPPKETVMRCVCTHIHSIAKGKNEVEERLHTYFQRYTSQSQMKTLSMTRRSGKNPHVLHGTEREREQENRKPFTPRE